MNELEKYKKVFKDIFEIKDDELENLNYQDIPSWDSLGHMRIIQELEEQLNNEFDINEIIDVDTIKKIINLAKSKIK